MEDNYLELFFCLLIIPIFIYLGIQFMEQEIEGRKRMEMTPTYYQGDGVIATRMPQPPIRVSLT